MYNYTKKECKESKRKFKKSYDRRFDKGFHQYLAKYEGNTKDIDGLNIEDALNNFEALILSIKGNEGPNSIQEPTK